MASNTRVRRSLLRRVTVVTVVALSAGGLLVLEHVGTGAATGQPSQVEKTHKAEHHGDKGEHDGDKGEHGGDKGEHDGHCNDGHGKDRHKNKHCRPASGDDD